MKVCKHNCLLNCLRFKLFMRVCRFLSVNKNHFHASGLFFCDTNLDPTYTYGQKDTNSFVLRWGQLIVGYSSKRRNKETIYTKQSNKN